MDSTIPTHTEEGVEREEIFVMTQTEVLNITEENTTVEQPVAIATEPTVAMEQFVEGHYDDERLPSSADKADELPTAEDEIAGVNELDDSSKVTSVEEDNDDANFTSVKIYRFLFGGLMKDKGTISADDYDDEVQDGDEKISSVDPDPTRDISEPIESKKTEEVFEKIPAAENVNIESANDASPSLTGRFLNIFKRGTTEDDQERKLDDETIEDTPADRRKSLENRESEILVEHETAQDENDEKESAENLPILLAGKFRNIFQTRQDDERDDHSLSQATQDPEVEIASASRQQELDDGHHETGDEDEVELMGEAKTSPAHMDISNGRYDDNESKSEVIDEISETIVVGVESNPQHLEEDRSNKDTQISSPEEYSVAEKIMIFETPRNEEASDRASATEEIDNEIAVASSQTEKENDYKNTSETEDPQSAGAIEYLPMLIASKLRNAFTKNADDGVPQAETTTAEEIVTDPDREIDTALPRDRDDYKRRAESGSPVSDQDAKETIGTISPASSQAQEEGDVDDNSAENKDDVTAGAALNLPTFLASKIRGAFQIQSDDNQDTNEPEATVTEGISEPTLVAVQNEPEEVSLTTAEQLLSGSDSDRVRESVSESSKQEVPEVGIAERIIGFLRPKRSVKNERLEDAENAGTTEVGSHYSDESQEERLRGIEEESKDADTEQNDLVVHEEITEIAVTVVESQYQEELPDGSEYGTRETVDPTAKPSSNLADRIREFLQPKRDQISQEETVSQATDDASSSQSQHKEPDQPLATSEIGQETESPSRTDNNESSTNDSFDIGRKIRNFFQPGRTKKDLSVSLDQEIKTDARTANQPPERESGDIADDNMESGENLHIFLAEKLVERLSEEELDSEENAEPQKHIVSEEQLEAKRVQSTLPEDSRDELVLMENRTEVNMDHTEDPNELRDASDSLDAFLQEDLNQHTSYEQGFTEEDGDDTRREEIISETTVKAVESQTKDMPEINEESPFDDQSEKPKSSRLPGILASAFKGFFQSKSDETPVDETGESALSTSVDMEEQVEIAHVSSVESGPPPSSHDIVEDSSSREAIADKIEEKETAENLPLYLAARMKKLLEPANKSKEDTTGVSDEHESLQELEKETSFGDEPETSHRQLDSVNSRSENKSRNEAESVDEEKETAENLPIYLANRLKGFLRPTRPEQNMHDCPLCGQKVSEDAFKDIEMNSNDGKLWKVRGVNLKCNLVSEIRGGVYKTEIRIAADGTRSMAESYYKLV